MKLFLYCVFFFFSLFIKINSSEPPNGSILFAWQINRHGARAPYLGVKNGVDVYKEKWTQIEELSEVGKRMLYLLGVKVRKRYVTQHGLLSEEYNPHEIYIRSTDVNRTIESIESFLQGLYPFGTGPTIDNKVLEDENITYPPNLNEKYRKSFDDFIKENKLNDNKWALPYGMSVEPVHLFYKPAHEFGLYDTNVCKGHKETYEKQKTRNEVFDFADQLLKNFSFFYNLEETDSSNKSCMHEYWTIYKYMDGYICDDVDQRDFKNINQIFNEFNDKRELLKIASKDFLLMDYSDTNYPEGHNEIPIIANSYTMHSLVNWMEKAIAGNETGKNYTKYVIYSAHDSSIGALEYFMKYAFKLTPEYATFAETRYFELYINEKNEKRVRYIKGDNTEKMDIDFKQFKEIINKTTWTDSKVSDFCQFEVKDDTNNNPSNDKKDDKKDDDDEKQTCIIAMIILSIINLILILFLILTCLRK